VIETKNLNQITILRPHLINNLLDKFGNEVVGKRICRTPGTPRLVQPEKDSELIDVELQSYSAIVTRQVTISNCSTISALFLVKEKIISFLSHTDQPSSYSLRISSASHFVLLHSLSVQSTIYITSIKIFVRFFHIAGSKLFPAK
jgi:hypothetical protein